MIEQLVSEFVRQAPPYQMGTSVQEIKEKYGFREVYKLSANENPLGVSPLAIAAIQKAVLEANFYPDASGSCLPRKLAEKLHLKSSQIMITQGATAGLNVIGEVFVQPGDEVIFPTPTYPGYYNVVKKTGAKLTELPMGDDLEMDFDEILNHITEKTKLVMICNPNNPTGIAADAGKLLEFIKKVPKHAVVLVDEAYVHFVEGPYNSMVNEISDNLNLVVLQTFSKLYGMAGTRIGYIMSNDEIMTYINRNNAGYTTNSLAYAAAEAALDDADFVRRTLENNREGRNFLTEELTAMGCRVFPSSTNFIYADCHCDAFRLSQEVAKRGVMIRGNFPLTRISIGTPEQNARVIRAIREILCK